MTLMFGMLAYYQIGLTVNVQWAPLLVVLILTTALGAALWLSALVKYRDIGHVRPFMVQLWLFATPVVYPSSLLSEGWRILYGFNPMAGLIEAFRWALLGGTAPALPMLVLSYSSFHGYSD